MDNPEKLAIQDTQDDDKQNENTTHNICWKHLYTRTHKHRYLI